MTLEPEQAAQAAQDADLLTIIRAPESLPAIIEARQDAETTASLYRDYTVATNDDWTNAAEDLALVKRKISDLAEIEAHIMSPLREHTTRLRDLFAVPRDRLNAAKSAIERPMVSYRERIARERAEAERAQLEQARAEQSRQQAEARKIVEEAARKRELAEKLANELADSQAAGTVVAEALRDLQAAEDAEQTAAEALHVADTAPLQVSSASLPELPKAQGTQSRIRWSGKPIGGDSPEAHAAALGALVRAAAADPSLIGFLSINQTAINQAATALKAHARIPGFVFAPTTTIASARK